MPADSATVQSTFSPAVKPTFKAANFTTIEAAIQAAIRSTNIATDKRPNKSTLISANQ